MECQMECIELQEIGIKQAEIIKKQNKLIETLKQGIDSAETSRQFWIDKYYDLSEEMMKKEQTIETLKTKLNVTQKSRKEWIDKNCELIAKEVVNNEF